MKCPHCNNADDRDMIRHKANKYGITRMYCKVCQSYWQNKDVPKVLLFDIETSRVNVEKSIWPDEIRRPSYLGQKAVKDDWYIISWAGKWLFSPESFGDVVRPKEGRDDGRVTKSLHKVIKQADVVITHNGNKFDIKKINWRFLIHSLEPAQRYKSIDTLKESRAVFGATSYAMDFLCRQLGYDQKHKTDYGLWEDCEAGDKEALQKMYLYNQNDVFMLEDLYLRMRGWFRNHPSFSYMLDMYQPLEVDEFRCRRCLQVVHKTKFTQKWTTPAGYVYKSCNCPECGALLRQTVREGGQSVRIK